MPFSPLLGPAQLELAQTLLDEAWSQLESRSSAGAHARDRERLSYVVESILMSGETDRAQLVSRIVDRFRALSARFPERLVS